MSPFEEIAVGNTPPVLRFEPNGKTVQGPRASLAAPVAHGVGVDGRARSTCGCPTTPKYTSGSNAPPSGARAPVQVRWSKYRGPGAVTFDKPRPEMEKLQSEGSTAPFSGKATVNAKFAEPGDYFLHVIGERLLRRRRRRLRLLLDHHAGEGGGQALIAFSNRVIG